MEQSSTNWVGADVGDNSDQPLITWTIFPDVHAHNFIVRRTTLHELAQHIVDAGPYSDKKACPLIKLAKFGVQRTGGGAMRSNENVERVTGVEGDYDGGVIQPEDAVQMLERAGIRAIIYTTPNHMVFDPPKYNGGPRWRVLAPFSTDYPPQERDRFLARVNGALGGILAPESFTLSQTYFYGEVTGVEHRLFVTFDDPEDGSCVDELHELDAIGIMSKPQKTAPDGQVKAGPSIKMFQEAVWDKGRLLRTGDNRRAMLRDYIASRSARGLLKDEILLMVEGVINTYFDPEDPPDAKDLMTMVDHFVRADTKAGKTSQPVMLSILDKIGLNSNGTVIDQETGEVLNSKPPLFEHVGESMSTLKRTQWAIERYLEQDALSVVYGPSGVGKSFVVISMACCVATGTSWFGMPVHQGPVFYIAGEGHNGLMRRFKAWSQDTGVSLDKAPLFKSRRAVLMLDPSAAADLREEIDRLFAQHGRPSMIVVDTLARNFGDGDENAAKDMGRFVSELDKIRSQYHCHIMVVHHSGHGQERARGSSSLRAAIDQEISIAGKAGRIGLQVTKMKDEEEPSPRMFKIKQLQIAKDEDGEPILGATIALDGDPMDFEVGRTTAGNVVTARMVVDHIRVHAWSGFEVLSIAMGLSVATARRVVERCTKDHGLLEKSGRGFTLTEKAAFDPKTAIDRLIDESQS